MSFPEREEKTWAVQKDDYPLFERLKLHLLVKNINKIAKNISHDAKKLSICDIGCGYHAPILNALSQNFEKCTGIDFAVTEKVIKNNITLLSGEGSSVLQSLPENQFDIITFLSVMEHIDERKSMLLAAKHALKPNGIIYINSPSWFGKFILEKIVIPYIDKDDSYKQQVDTHKTYFYHWQMWQLLIDAGFVSSKINISTSNFGCSVTAYARL